MANKPIIEYVNVNKVHVMSVIHSAGWSCRALGKDKRIGRTEKTIRRALDKGKISFALLSNISKVIGVPLLDLVGTDGVYIYDIDPVSLTDRELNDMTFRLLDKGYSTEQVDNIMDGYLVKFTSTKDDAVKYVKRILKNIQKGQDVPYSIAKPILDCIIQEEQIMKISLDSVIEAHCKSVAELEQIKKAYADAEKELENYKRRIQND